MTVPDLRPLFIAPAPALTQASDPGQPAFWQHFGYDATDGKNKRKAPDGILRSEDQELLPEIRRKLVSAARDLPRNFALASWMIRKHLDYVSTFAFRATTGNAVLDDQLEAFVRKWSQRQNCDAARRHRLLRIIRLAEARRTIDGDVFLLKLKTGKVQAIEGDRIRTPTGGLPAGYATADFLHGVQTDEAGAAKAYCVCRRGKSSDFQPAGGQVFQFERIVSAENCIQHAYFDRFDQVRGISPLAPALNSMRDTYEGFDYALAKLKVAQLFGLSIYRNGAGEDGFPPVEQDEDGEGYQVSFGNGPFLLDLDAGDRAEFLESKSPSTEMQSFTQSMIGLSMKALDLPYSFYAENYTNYSGARQALLQYEDSARDKREDNRAILDELTSWRLDQAVEEGEFPKGTKREDLRGEWIPRGVPWIDPLKEIQADTEAVESCMASRSDILKERGKDFFEVADRLAEEEAYLKERGLPTLADKLKAKAAAPPPAQPAKKDEDTQDKEQDDA